MSLCLPHHLKGELDLCAATAFPLLQVFGIMEQAKKDYMLEDYSINQVSLEDIFLSLTSPMSSTKGKFQQGQAVVASPLSSFHLLSPLHSSSQPSIPPPSPPPSEPVLL